jgi:hypothetical protein
MSTQAVPPPPSGGSKPVVPHVGTSQNYQPGTGHVAKGEGRVQICHFSNNPSNKDYFKKLISHNRCLKLAPFLLQCQSSPIFSLQAVIRESVAYIVTQANKSPPSPACLSQSTTLHSTGNISADGSENKKKSQPQLHSGTVSSLLFFPL